MKKIILTILLLAFPLVCFAPWPAFCESQDRQDAATKGRPKHEEVLQITIDSDRTVYGLEDPITIEAKIKNVSNKSIRLVDYCDGSPVKSFYFQNDKGQRCKLTHVGREPCRPLTNTLPLSPTALFYNAWGYPPINLLEAKEGKAAYSFELESKEDYALLGKHKIYMQYWCLTSNAISIEVVEKSQQEKTHIPKNLEDCFVELKEILSEEDLNSIKNSKEEDLVKFHHSLGRWIRNNWIRKSGSELKEYFNGIGIFHPDDMSSIILTSFHRHLNNRDARLEEQIKYYQEYWEKIAEDDSNKVKELKQ